MMSVVEMVRRPREQIGVDARAQEFEGISEVGCRVARGGRTKKFQAMERRGTALRERLYECEWECEFDNE